MNNKTNIKWEWIIIGILSVIIVSGTYLYLKKEQELRKTKKNEVIQLPKVETEKDQMLRKYENLELSYNNTINKIENVVNDDNINLSILKENLQQILETIKAEKQRISQSNIDSIKTSSEKKAKQLDELLEMSKEVLAERLIEIKEKNSKLTIDNRKLYYNLKKSVDLFDEEKARNIRLNEEISNIKEKINTLKEEGTGYNHELKTLKKEKAKLEKELITSTKIIKKQDKQIQDMGEIIRKINIDCYYIYEVGNSTDEAKIYLTQQGISERYVQYFIRKKPDIYVTFKIPRDIYGEGIKKIELKLYNSLNIEIYSVVKAVKSPEMKIIIPNKNFLPGKYSISITSGDENLIVDDRY